MEQHDFGSLCHVGPSHNFNLLYKEGLWPKNDMRERVIFAELMDRSPSSIYPHMLPSMIALLFALNLNRRSHSAQMNKSEAQNSKEVWEAIRCVLNATTIPVHGMGLDL
jgi:hypothetical protein